MNKMIKRLILIVTSVLLVIFFYRAFLENKLYESDDYELHAARTANYYLALKQGQFPVRWAPNLNDGYGYPSFNYMYPLPYLISVGFHFINLPIQQSLNLSMLISVLLSFIGMFFLGKSISKNNFISIASSFVFIFSPYILLNTFWRGAIGESYFIAFFIFCFLGVISFLKSRTTKNKKLFSLLLIVFSTASMILSHFPSMLLSLPLILSYLLILLYDKKINYKQIITIVLSGIAGFLLSAWYWVPAVLEQKYIKYQSGSSLKQYQTQFVNFRQIFSLNGGTFKSDYFLEVIQLGLPILVIIAFLIIYIFKKKLSDTLIYWSLFCLFLSIIFITQLSDFIWDNISLIQYIQYPWRFIWVTMFSAIICLHILSKYSSKRTLNVISTLLLCLSILTATRFAHIKGYKSRDDFDWYQSVIAGSSFDEHQPVWSRKPYQFSEQVMLIEKSDITINEDTTKNLPVRPLDEVDSSVLLLNGTKLLYEINNDKNLILLHKRIYFPGWIAKINNQNVDILINIPQYNGVIALDVPAGKNTIEISFSGKTQVRKVAELISLVTLVLIGSISLSIYLKSSKA